MRKIESEYICLLKEQINSQNGIIDKLLRVNEDLIQDVKNLVYEFRRFLENEAKFNEEKNKIKRRS